MIKSIKINRLFAFLAAFLLIMPIFLNIAACKKKNTEKQEEGLSLYYSFDEGQGSSAYDSAGKITSNIKYVFNASNQEYIFKPSSDPLWRKGVKGNALYMDGFSTYVESTVFGGLEDEFTLSAWVAPRVFENLDYYSGDSIAAGNPKMTAVISQGNIEAGEGFLLGYGRLGMWGLQLCLENPDTYDELAVCFYDPVNYLPLYEWSHIAVSFSCETGHVAMYLNGEVVYEDIFDELIGWEVLNSSDKLLIGKYRTPSVVFGVDRQMVGGLLDEVKIYENSLNNLGVKALYKEGAELGHPALSFEDVGLDSSVYEGDRYRPQYHAIPPAVWMNEPHSPFYYKGYYHVFYQHNPAGPYWSQIRWGHLVSQDMIHWKYVKDAVAPTAGICPEGVWTGGAVIGPDGLPWLAITAGTNTSTWSGQNIAFAHPKDPDDPYLSDWVVEDIAVITQPDDDSQGERDQFRDPFVWYDDGVYYMVVSTSVPHAGGSGNVYTSSNMREWEYRGYLYQNGDPVTGAHWECVVMLPISSKDGSKTKYILFDCPQYTVDGFTVECYYWIGEFDKSTCRFIADDDTPKLMDYGRGIFTGQNGFCYLTEEQEDAGYTYEQGRTIVYAIAQGKAAGTTQNKYAGWAHNFAMPVELWLSDNGELRFAPIEELESARDKKLYEYSGNGMDVQTANSAISDIRGDLLEIDMTVSIAPTEGSYKGGIMVRYNPESAGLKNEMTKLIFSNDGVFIDRSQSTMYSHIDIVDTHVWHTGDTEFKVKILLDRSMLEVYINDRVSFTTRIYPKHEGSDYIRFFSDGAGLTVKSLTVYSMGSVYSDSTTPAYYGNTGGIND